MRAILAIAVALMLVLAGPALASVTVSNTAPTTDIKASQANYGGTEAGSGNGYDLQNRSGAFRTAGQIFTAETTFNLTAITLGYVTESTRLSPMPLTLNLYEAAAANGDAPVGAILRTLSGTLAYAAGVQYVTFDVADIVVEAGKFYGFEITIDGPVGGTKRFGDPGFLLNDPLLGYDAYTGGVPIRRVATSPATATTYTHNDESDLVFFVQGTDVADVPEPVTMSLLCLGAVGVLARRRK